MRARQYHRPRWNMLALILIVAVCGLAAEHNLHLTPAGHKVALLVIIVVGYGSLGVWVKSNEVALETLDIEADRKQNRDNPELGGTPQLSPATPIHLNVTMSESLNERKGAQV